jgi:hypothetical protein
VDFTILDISDYDPPHVPSKTWRELIKKVWEIDPLTCPRCGSDLPAIGFAIRRGGRFVRYSSTWGYGSRMRGLDAKSQNRIIGR